MTADFITLSTSKKNQDLIRPRVKEDFLFRSMNLMTIRLYDNGGQPMLISLGYLASMARQGYVGLDKIPHACIFREDS